MNCMVRFRHLFAVWCTLCSLIAFDLSLAREGSRSPGDFLEVRPRHFRLKVGERIHYQALSSNCEGEMRFLKDFEFDTTDPTRLAFSRADGHFLATRHGTAEIILRSGGRERRIEVVIEDAKLAQMKTVTDDQVASFAAEDVLFVNHANRDGFDHTAVAKPGIDRWIRSFKEKGAPIIYFVSREYPNWYPEDRTPTHAVVTEGGDHNLSFTARRVFFTGGDARLCLLRNAQFTLHRVLKEKRIQSIHFVFPTDAIWTMEPGKPYPAPMVTLERLLDRHSSRETSYERVLLPILRKLVEEYPIGGYPRDSHVPSPPLRELLEGWTISVDVDGVFQRLYRTSDSGRVIRLEFQRRQEISSAP